MVTNSTSAQNSGQHEHAECPRCVALAESSTALLEALEELVAGVEKFIAGQAVVLPLDKARAAIAAARGEAVVLGQPERRQRYRKVTEEHQRRTAPS